METSNTTSVPRVLVVEDEPDIAALIAYQLTREGFRVETAGSGTEALDAVAREVPDLVVLDARTGKDWKTCGQGLERTRKEISNFSLTRNFQIKDWGIPSDCPGGQL